MTTPQYPKRPGSPLGYQSLPPAKAPRLNNSSQLQINYLIRQKQETLPLVTEEERMPWVLQLIGEYDGVLQRHESMAGNLGAVPLGPILLKRFERLFDGPPRVLKSHAKDPNITWLDVVEFAQNRPEQFNLEKQRNGVRVCQFYHKQCRVEISEEDYVLVASGMPQKLIPPQPILEDEEKELGVMEMLERNLSKIFQMADQVSARARQLNHKLKNRRAAILARREAEGDPHRQATAATGSPMSPLIDINAQRGIHGIEQSQSPPMGFTAVNVRHPLLNETDPRALTGQPQTMDQNIMAPGSNGRPTTIKGDDLSKFLTAREVEAGMTMDSVRRTSLPQLNRDSNRQVGQLRSRQDPVNVTASHVASSAKGSPSVPIPSTPASLLPQANPVAVPKDDGGPYKVEMVARMESMHRGERILPPCDRCRRLQMDCIKNLTACQGCTKKHAKCSWKDVSHEELNGSIESARASIISRPSMDRSPTELGTRDWNQVVQDKPEPERSKPPDPASHQADPTELVSSARSGGARSPASSSLQYTPSQTSSKLDVRPPPIEQNRELSNERAQQPRYSAHGEHEHHRHKTDSAQGHTSGDEDSGDRLQELARKVYRSASASQGTRPPSS